MPGISARIAKNRWDEIEARPPPTQDWAQRIGCPRVCISQDFLSRRDIDVAKPSHKATLDRINNIDPEYAPGKVRWADKRTQNSNKGDTLLFFYPRTKDTYTVSRVAALQGVRKSTIRKRKERGWTDEEIIEGRRQTAVPCYRERYSQPEPRLSGSHDFEGKRRTAVPNYRERHSQPEPKDSIRQVPAYCLASSMERNNDAIVRRSAELTEEERIDYGISHGLAEYEAWEERFKTRERLEQDFEKWWAQRKHSVILEYLPQWAQELISKIDPSATQEANERAKAANERAKAAEERASAENERRNEMARLKDLL